MFYCVSIKAILTHSGDSSQPDDKQFIQLRHGVSPDLEVKVQGHLAGGEGEVAGVVHQVVVLVSLHLPAHHTQSYTATHPLNLTKANRHDDS